MEAVENVTVDDVVEDKSEDALPQNMRLFYDGADCLRKISEPWNFETDGDPMPLARDMYKIMQAFNGIGLAAPQVGVNKRVIVSIYPEFSGYYFNPKVIFRSVEPIRLSDGEGCLSFPGLTLRIVRSQSILLEWQNEKGELKQDRFEGLPAVVFQHEVDHLDGKLFVDYFGKTGKDMIKRKQAKIKKKMEIAVRNHLRGRG